MANWSGQKVRVHKLPMSGMKETHHYSACTYRKDNKGILWTTLCHKFKNWVEMDKFLKKTDYIISLKKKKMAWMALLNK